MDTLNALALYAFYQINDTSVQPVSLSPIDKDRNPSKYDISIRGGLRNNVVRGASVQSQWNPRMGEHNFTGMNSKLSINFHSTSFGKYNLSIVNPKAEWFK